jgi:hypothetical protein
MDGRRLEEERASLYAVREEAPMGRNATDPTDSKTQERTPQFMNASPASEDRHPPFPGFRTIITRVLAAYNRVNGPLFAQGLGFSFVVGRSVRISSIESWVWRTGGDRWASSP